MRRILHKIWNYLTNGWNVNDYVENKCKTKDVNHLKKCWYQSLTCHPND